MVILDNYFVELEPESMIGPLPAICPICGKPADDIEIHVRNTAYVNQAENYITCCGECILEDNAYWQEQWDEYYAGRL